MNDNLRTRIAAVLYAMDCDDYDIQVGEQMDPSVLWAIQEGAERRADAVIRELGLKSQWINDGIISDGPPPNWVLPCDVRYTTEWERSD